MAGVLTERKPFLLLLILLTVNLGFMSSRVRGTGQRSILEDAILGVASPFLKVASWVARSSGDIWGSYVDLRGVRDENRRLRSELDALAPKANEAEEIRLELERLRQLLDLKTQITSPSIPARVIARGEAGGDFILTLDRGTRAGVAVNHPVITPRGVVGRVIQAAAGSSKVQTILDPNSGVAAVLQRTRVQGMLIGEGARGCRLEYVSELADVEVGDVVITSGLDRIHPKGSILGVVTEIAEGEGLTKLVRVRPEVEVRSLEEVLVVIKPDTAPVQETK